MKKWILLMLAAGLLFLGSGCAVVEKAEVLASIRPDLYWKDYWIIEEQLNQIEVLDETGESVVKIDIYGRIRYAGEQPVDNVSVIIRSPLTFDFIEDHQAVHYGTVQPGEVLEYRLLQDYPEWQERVPIGVYKEHIIDDFKGNAYVQISWEKEGESFEERFFSWKPK